jgi:hypothetical protein
LKYSSTVLNILIFTPNTTSAILKELKTPSVFSRALPKQHKFTINQFPSTVAKLVIPWITIILMLLSYSTNQHQIFELLLS